MALATPPLLLSARCHHVGGSGLQKSEIHPDAPAALYFAGAHAIEFIANEQCAAVAEALAGRRRDLLDRVRFWFFPVMNPDGHARVRELLATYEQKRDLILLGAYKAGSDPRIDKAMAKNDPIAAFLRQGLSAV